MKRFLLTTAVLTLTAILAVSSVSAQTGMHYPNWFAFEQIAIHHADFPVQPFFECNFTKNICVKGHALSGPYGVDLFVGVVLDGIDRKTELKHLKCWANFKYCDDYDIGVGYDHGLTPRGRVITAPDMPAACVDLMRETGSWMRNSGPCKGYGLDFSYKPN